MKSSARLHSNRQALVSLPSTILLAQPKARSIGLQPKLSISKDEDEYEREADRVANEVMRMSSASPLNNCSCPGLSGRKGDCPECRRESGPSLQPKPQPGGHGHAQNSEQAALADAGPEALPTIDRVAQLPSCPLDTATRALMESRFGHDFSQVRVHTGLAAQISAGAINALAYTVGPHIVFGAGQHSPHSEQGRRLLAHELTHVLQQQCGVRIQRQEIPLELRSSVNPTRMTDAQLHQRYDMIVTVLGWFTRSSPEIAILEEEGGRIGAELTSRSLTAGRTFAPEAIERMRGFFIQNAKKAKPRNCIDTMNEGLQLLFQDKKQRFGDSVDKTMAALQRANRAGEGRMIEFEDRKGRVSRTGSLYPFKVHESVWDAVIQMNGVDLGWSVFGMGPADMSHSVTLTLDNNDPTRPAIYWSDQWSSKGGWKKYDKAGLDAAVAEVTQIIWNKKDDKHKPDTKVTLWRLRQNLEKNVAVKPQ